MDIVRGVVMVLMVLDHVRGHLSNGPSDPTALESPTPGLFFARWVTHFCAPAFVLLAGTSAYFYGKSHSRAQLSRFLWTRGLWLVVLELTVVRLAWTYSLALNMGVFVQVIWAIGISMTVLAALVRLPVSAIAVFGVGMMVLHHLLDPLKPATLGSLAPLFAVLHEHGPTRVAGVPVMVLYPLVPWIGVMAAGYALGRVFDLDLVPRARVLMRLGAALCVGFVLVRTLNAYGDPHPWKSGASAGVTFMHWLATTKYPPSLAYLLMTLGPVLLALGALERFPQAKLRWLLAFGRVPLFLYVVHLYLAHALAVVVGTLTGFAPGEFLTIFVRFPEGFGLSLPGVLLAWLASTAVLYPACAWYGGVKRRSRSPIFSYL